MGDYMFTETFKLSNDVKIPAIAIGTWQTPNDIAKNVVATALELGYRHIDTAIDYGNEVGVGIGVAESIKNSNINREDIFITSKILAETKNYTDAKQSINDSLIRLNVEYIDLLLIHAPKPWAEMWDSGPRYFKENLQVWKALEEAYAQGKVRAIGVSNFNVIDLKNIINNAKIKPMVNQLCAFISNMPEDEIDFCKSEEILVTGYSPIATGRLLGQKDVELIAKKYNVSIPQLCIRYLIERGVLPLPKTIHKEYMKSNADVNFKISKEDIEILNKIKFTL